MAIFEGVCERRTERVFDSAFALRSYPEYIGFFRLYAVPWFSDFLHAPHDPGSSSGPPQDVLVDSRGPVFCVPFSFSWSAVPWGSVGGQHSLWLAINCSPPLA